MHVDAVNIDCGEVISFHAGINVHSSTSFPIPKPSVLPRMLQSYRTARRRHSDWKEHGSGIISQGSD